MKNSSFKKQRIKPLLYKFFTFVCILVIMTLFVGCHINDGSIGNLPGIDTTESTQSTVEQTEPETEPLPIIETGYVASLDLTAEYFDANGNSLGTLPRGAKIEYTLTEDNVAEIIINESVVYLGNNAYIVSDSAEAIPSHTLYVRSAVNLRDVNGRILNTFANKGTALEIKGFDFLYEDGNPHMYKVDLGGEEGYVMPWYLTSTEADALANYDSGSYYVHANRGNKYGGGGAADLDYYPRQKGPIDGNEMPNECRTLYLEIGALQYADDYINLANQCGINAFVVDISNGGAIGYASDVLNTYSPTSAAAAFYTVEQYQENVQKLKAAGYYVIGRITTFTDTFFIQDHPEYAIADKNGNPFKLHGSYWPTPYNRSVWQYKVDLAVEAVKLMGFNEIQFDYVRFPDRTWSYESSGTIDFRNAYGETKAQAIQRFLMYATDILHENGVYVSADVYGESSNAYVTAYGQYWPAISNVADVISGMPYPDHYEATGNWKPWEHPYETLYNWGKNVMIRQGETATPAIIRTWIQAYNAIKEPYNTYGPNEISAQIQGLRDAGCTGGYMTWNASSNLWKYSTFIPAFGPPDQE